MFLFLFSPFVFANETLRLSTGEWAPYISEHLEQNGILAQITTEAFALKGIDVDLGFFPWERAAQLSRTGAWDGTIAFVHLAERENFYIYSAPIYIGHYAFFHLKSYPFKWRNYEDLSKITIASTIGFGGMGDKFIDAEKKGVIKVLRLNSDTQSFNMLMAKRAEAVPSDIEVGYALARKLYGKDAALLTHNSNYILTSEYHLVISRKHKNSQALVDKFNEGLAQLRKSGRYDEIIRTWYNKAIYKEAMPTDYLKQKKIAKKMTSKY